MVFSGTQGQEIYKALLQKHTNITDVKTTEQYDLGNSQVSGIKNAMTQVANKIADLKAGANQKWEETFMYDSDSSNDSHNSQSVTAIIRDQSGNINLSNFFKWLNSDQFFNGRDMTNSQFPTIDGTTPLDNWLPKGQTTPSLDDKTPYKYATYPANLDYNSQDDYVKKIIGFVNDTNENETITWGDAGNLYVKYIKKGLSPATIQTSNTIKYTDTPNSISAAAAYIGASNAVSQYLIYKEATASNFSKAFKNTSTNYTLRTGTGGAAYANSGTGGTKWVDQAYGGFYLDVNPYFGLQKWSMSTLSNHESVTGHVFQFNYAEEHPADENTVSIRSTAYAEGWGLFSEWLAVQFGTYGTPVSLTINNNNGNFSSEQILALPEFGVDSRTNDITKLENYANDVYKIDNQNNQTYYDALQYFGFLNERQLRAMRITVDVGLHAGENGTFEKGKGYSLKQARNYLQSNSGLGIDDINRETKRYLEYTAQATSYYNGLIKITDYFLKAQWMFEKANPQKTFMDYKNLSSTNNNTSGLFDLILRNGNQPLESLSWGVDTYLNSLYQ